jgi:hypothetical protein
MRWGVRKYHIVLLVTPILVLPSPTLTLLHIAYCIHYPYLAALASSHSIPSARPFILSASEFSPARQSSKHSPLSDYFVTLSKLRAAPHLHFSGVG